MIHSLQRKEPDFRWMLVCSFFIHLTCYFLLFIFHFAPKPFKEGPVYYVDIVNLPVANPQAGAPSTYGSPPAVPARQEMTLPQKTAGKTTLKTIPSKKETPSVETERQFEERMAKIARTVDARDHSAALDALQKKVGAGGKSGQAGMPGAKGTEAGSDYAAYIRSRLTDAFAKTIAYQTKSPTVLVSITIDRNGRVIALKIEKSSADRLFEDSVRRAILKAEQTFPPPPGGATFEYSYRFAPEGVSKK